mmetsp:Transcript_27747/g.29887  ORF Transcript_27747/g.29887 Transcript_27747/m.29887 type:complete len:165 (-) Transcript_27747:159-653(-)
MATATRMNLKNIPIILANALISDWNTSKFVLDSICSMNKCKHFLKMNKHMSLPDYKEPGTGLNHLAAGINAVEKHALCLHIMVLSCQKNKELVALLKATESEDWLGVKIMNPVSQLSVEPRAPVARAAFIHRIYRTKAQASRNLLATPRLLTSIFGQRAAQITF